MHCRTNIIHSITFGISVLESLSVQSVVQFIGRLRVSWNGEAASEKNVHRSIMDDTVTVCIWRVCMRVHMPSVFLVT
jgi:hypothetical protein